MGNTAYVLEETIAERVKQFMSANNMDNKTLASKLGVSRPLISRYLNGTYDSDPTKIENQLEEFLRNNEENSEKKEDVTSKTNKRAEIFQSRDFINIVGLCKSCQRDEALGLVVGKSGFGKTHTLRYYANMDRVAYIECDDIMSCKDLVEDIEKALGIPNTYGTIHRRLRGIKEFFNVNEGYLLIIDEADKLISKYTQKKMELLRSIIDQSSVGIVIAGEPRLESEIKNYLKRFGNRVDLYWKLTGLVKSEVAKFVENFEVDESAMTELIIRACNEKTGCFRLLDRTMKNIDRIMKETGENKITVKLVKQASNMMML